MGKSNDEFLDLDVNKSIEKFRANYKEEYELTYEVINLLRKCEESYVGMDANMKNSYLCSAVVQLNKLFQSAVIMFERGLKESGNIIIRSVMELVLEIMSVIRKDDFMGILLNEEEKGTRAILNDIKNNQFFDIFPKDTVEKMIEECNENINATLKKPNMKQMAEENNLNKLYIIYRIHSGYVHQSVGNVVEILKEVEGGVVIDGDFQLDEFKTSIALLIIIVLQGLEVIIDEFLKNDCLKEERQLFEKKMIHVFKSEIQ